MGDNRGGNPHEFWDKYRRQQQQKNDNGVPDGNDEADIIISAMDIDNYKMSYDGYAFSQPSNILSGTTITTKPHRNYLKVAQGQGDPTSPPDTAERNAGSFNQYNQYISVYYVPQDNQYTVDVFRNASLLTKIRQYQQTLHLSCNAGTIHITLVEELKGYGKIWFHPGGIASIISLSRFKNLYCVIYDSSKGNSFMVHIGNGITRRFMDSPQDL